MNKHDKELHAMMVCRTAVAGLTHEERMRVLSYLHAWAQDQRPHSETPGILGYGSGTQMQFGE